MPVTLPIAKEIATTPSILIRKPSLLVVLCIALWAGSLALAFHNNPPTDDIAETAFVAGP